ncbi:MAG: MG2 domain-containing protein, partial [Chloroflexota bacterium]
MSQENKSGKKRKNALIIAATAVIAIVVIGGGIWAVRTFTGSDAPNGVTIPTLQTQTGITQVAETGSAAGRGGGSLAKLVISLSQGQAQPDAPDSNPVVTGAPLTEAQITQILDRLPPLATEEGDVQDYNLPDELLPPPLTGATIEESFPPPPAQYTAPEIPDGPLEVLRYSPEGDVGLAPFINVTFNQPMVPLTDLESLSAADVPVTLTPNLPGVWQWVSPQTLRFEYASDEVDRLPMATTFTAEIPAGTQSATGNALAETVRWTFTTPPVQLAASYPNSEPQPVEPVVFMAFDQLIDPQAVLNTIQVNANGRSHPMRLATEAEIAADEHVSRLVENSREGTWLALRPQQPFPQDAPIDVTIGPGTPSAEGPLTTTEAQSFSFYTYAPLEIVESRCGWQPDECRPLTPFTIEFNNPLDLNTFSETMVVIEPALPGAVVRPSYNMLTIQGMSKGRTTYRVTIDGAVQDIFGQTLGQDETVSFRVGTARPYLSGPTDMLVTLDPSAAEPQLTVYTMNEEELLVKAYAVTPGDWPAYLEYRRELDQFEADPTPPGQLVLDETIDTNSQEDVLTETAVLLSNALGEDKTGHLIVIVQPPRRFSDFWEERSQTVQTWVQATQIGLDALGDPTQLIVWTTDLEDGSPLANVSVAPNNGSVTVTGQEGLASIVLPGAGIQYLVATQGEDSAILPANPYHWDEYGWQPRPLEDELRWHIFDDRAMYRPGEEVHVKGWLRSVSGGSGAISLPGQQANNVTYQVYDPQGSEITTGSAEVNSLGGFDLAFTLPENSNLGYAYINLQAPGSGSIVYGRDAGHQFQIQEFRRPEFEVSARQETSGPYVVNDSATVAVAASYFAGGPLPNADTTWTVTWTPGQYAPPNWPGFTFGEWIPWWFAFGYGGDYYEEPYIAFGPNGFPEEQTVETFTGSTDANGEHYLQINFEELEGNRPFSVNAEASVMDVNRQAWASSTNLLVHPAALYVGLRSERTFVEQGDPLEIEVIVADIDGEAIPGAPVAVTANRLEWNLRNGRWLEEEVDPQTCTLTSTTEPLLCTFNTDKGGEMKITAVVTDNAGRQNQSSFTRWVSGGERPVQRSVELEALTLIPNQETYQPGDTAEILVQSPFADGEGLLTLNHGGVVATQRFALENGSATLRIPITEEHLPSLGLQVDVAGSAPRTDDDGNELPGVPPRPAYASGSLTLSIPPYSRELSVEIVPQAEKLEPGSETAVTLTVLNAGGQPVPDAEVALFAVDEAILALTAYQLAN